MVCDCFLSGIPIENCRKTHIFYVSFIILWTTGTSVVLFGLMRVGNLLRVKRDVEIRGLDMDHHLGYTGILRYAEEMESTVNGLEIEEGSISTSSLADDKGPTGPKTAIVVSSDSVTAT